MYIEMMVMFNLLNCGFHRSKHNKTRVIKVQTKLAPFYEGGSRDGIGQGCSGYGVGLETGSKMIRAPHRD